jgi:hypothetical protein
MKQETDPGLTFNKLFKHIREDVFHLWKLLQDGVGLKRLFGALEAPKQGYKIDYRQIDEIIGALNCGDRDYKYYKAKL